MNVRATLRSLVAKKNALVVPGAYDGVSARLVERAGFPAVYMTGYGTSASRLGLPDLGYVGLAEMADHARNLAAAVTIPLIADADTGYGNALSVARTVRAYEAAGVAGLHIEDQVAPKRCGHLSGHQIIPRGEFAGKIRAAVEARTDPDFLVIARTDAISAVDFDEALRRGEAAVKAGADVLFVEAPSAAELPRIAPRLTAPLLYNMATSGKTPFLGREEIERLGFKLIIYPNWVMLAAIRAADHVLATLKETGTIAGIAGEVASFREFFDLLGMPEVQALEARYGVDADARVRY